MALSARFFKGNTGHATYAFASSVFREDSVKINVLTLVIHGDGDKIVPIKATGERSAELIKDFSFIIYTDAAHGLCILKMNN